ncbi:cyclic lactone autoinducer peptide [Lacrimispora sp.]|nr:cyclic lactone autoinducer peptide [Lacrimispora sp.]
MKKVKNNPRVVSIISHMALGFSVIAANTLCCAIYHQPTKPDLKKLRKF